MDKGYLCVANWDRHSATTYAHLRTNKGNLQSWRYRIGKVDSGLAAETGDHVTFDCPEWDEWRVRRVIGGELRTWKTWGDLDLKVWINRSEDGRGEEIGCVLSSFMLTYVSCIYLSSCRAPPWAPKGLLGPWLRHGVSRKRILIMKNKK